MIRMYGDVRGLSFTAFLLPDLILGFINHPAFLATSPICDYFILIKIKL
jgi:hypothetical protein